MIGSFKLEEKVRERSVGDKNDGGGEEDEANGEKRVVLNKLGPKSHVASHDGRDTQDVEEEADGVSHGV